MAKYCPKCGNQVDDNAAFCGSCGNSFGAAQATATVNTGGPRPVVTNRSIASCIILSILTCGIYAIYWFVVMTDDANKVSGDNATSGLMAFVLTLLTCGIYGIYWYWKQGQKLYQAGKQYGVEIADNSVLYLILGLFGFGIVSYCLMQSDLNKFSN